MIITRNTARRILGRASLVQAIPSFHSLYESYRTASTSASSKGCCGGGVNSSSLADIEKRALNHIRGLSAGDVDKLRDLLGDRRLYIYGDGAGGSKVLKELGKS